MRDKNSNKQSRFFICLHEQICSMTQTPKYSDYQIVNGILNNDQTITQHFFLKECKPMFEYIEHAIFDDNVERDELVSELFLYLQHNDWHKIRQFDFRSKLTQYLHLEYQIPDQVIPCKRWI